MSAVTDTIETSVETAKAPATRASVYEASKEIAVRRDGGASLPMPTTFAQMQDFASTMSRAGPMVGKPFRDNPGACLAILTQSMRWNMDPYAVSQKAYVAAANGDGPIGYEGQLIAAVVQSIAPLQKRLRCEYSGEGDDRRITIIGYLIGEEDPFTYTSPPLSKLRPAKNSSGYLKGSQLWETDPDQQFWYYGVRAWSRKWTPEVIMGVYTPDELSEAVRSGQPIDGGETITLTGAVTAASEGETAQEAEFTPIDGLLNKGKPTPKKTADPKAGAKAAGDEASGEPDKRKSKTAKAAAGSAQTAAVSPDEIREDDDSRTQTLDRPSGDAPEEAQTATAAKPADSEPETDAQLVARVEAEVKAAKGAGRSGPIRTNRDALERIAREANSLLMGRADALLNMFDLDA